MALSFLAGYLKSNTKNKAGFISRPLNEEKKNLFFSPSTCLGGVRNLFYLAFFLQLSKTLS